MSTVIRIVAHAGPWPKANRYHQRLSVLWYATRQSFPGFCPLKSGKKRTKRIHTPKKIRHAATNVLVRSDMRG